MKTVSAKEMQTIDRRTIEEYGISSLILMENAGRGVADRITVTEPKPSKILVVCGRGNNGGDGLVAARHLVNRGYTVRVLLLCPSATLKGDPAVNFNIVSKMKIPIDFASAANLIVEADLILDAIYGIGLNRFLDEKDQKLIQLLNHSGKKIFAMDIPSGLNADSGRPMPVAVNAQRTFTLAAAKRGLLTGEGPKHSGAVEIIDIGIPKDLLATIP